MLAVSFGSRNMSAAGRKDLVEWMNQHSPVRDKFEYRQAKWCRKDKDERT